MLVAAFEIEVGGPVQVGPAAAFEHKGMGAAAVEPDVENVGDALVIGEVIVVAQETLRRGLAPGIDALFAHRGDYAGVDRGVAEILPGGAVDEQGDRHPPGALAGDHPVGAAFDHRTEAVAALFGDEARVGDGGDGLFAERASLSPCGRGRLARQRGGVRGCVGGDSPLTPAAASPRLSPSPARGEGRSIGMNHCGVQR